MSEPDVLSKARSEYMNQYKLLDLPAGKDEAWKHTKIDFDLNMGEGEQKIEYSKSKDIIFTDIKTAITKHLDLIKDHLPMSLISAEDKITAMHGALWNDGVFIYVPKNIDAGDVSNIYTAISGTIISHTLIILEENSRLRYSEIHLSKGGKAAFRNDIVEVYAGANSHMEFSSYKDFEDVKSISSWTTRLDRDSSVRTRFFQFGGKLSRIKIDHIFAGRGSESKIAGIFYGNADQHFDFTTDADHTVPNTTCNIIVKGALKGSSSAVYRGKIKIRKEAQQTNSYLEDHTLILSRDAVSDSIPSLEIDANDVKASHGATLGKPDEEEIFYLMARGLPREEAEKTIVKGFFAEIIEDDEIGKAVQETLDRM